MTITRKLNYPGQRSDILHDRPILGPDLRGIKWVPYTGTYNPATDITTIVFRPATDQDLSDPTATLASTTTHQENKP